METIDSLLKQGVPLKAARDYRLVKIWLGMNKELHPSWQKRYEDIKAKYNLS